MRSRVRDLIGSLTRGIVTSAVLATAAMGALFAWAGSATATTDEQLAQTPSGVDPFGFVGPVGVVAVGLGLAGMIAGIARRRREVVANAAAARRAAARARAAQYAHPEDYGMPVPRPSLPPVVEQPTRKLAPVQRSRAA